MVGRAVPNGLGIALTRLRTSLWRQVPVLWQTEAQECGVVCVAMVTAYHGRDLDLAELRARGLAGARGSTLSDLVALAEAEGMNCRGLRLEPEHLKRLAAPAVLHWDLNHFVVLVKVRRRGVWIHDPAQGRRRYSWAELSRHFTGVALELRPSDRFRARPLARRLKLTDLWRGAVGLGGALVTVLALSLLLQVTLVLAPLQVQWVIDQGVMRADRELIALLALGFAMLLLVRLAAQLMRGWLITRLTFLLAFEFGRNLFAHMLRLPLDWFEKRHLGDITSRFGSLGPVRDAMTQGLVTVGVDGFMALAMLAMMLAYDAWLAALVLAACVLYLLLRFAQAPALARISMDEINHQARADSSFLESMRAMPAVRVYAQERARLDLWQNQQAGAINAGIRGAKFGLLGDGAQTLIFGVETIAIIYLGAQHVLDGALTIGMLYAFLSYKGEFTGRLGELVRQALELRLLRVHLERLADPYCATAELSTDPVSAERIAGALRLTGVGFRYGEREPWVLRDVDLEVEPGGVHRLGGAVWRWQDHPDQADDRPIPAEHRHRSGRGAAAGRRLAAQLPGRGRLRSAGRCAVRGQLGRQHFVVRPPVRCRTVCRSLPTHPHRRTHRGVANGAGNTGGRHGRRALGRAGAAIVAGAGAVPGTQFPVSRRGYRASRPGNPDEHSGNDCAIKLHPSGGNPRSVLRGESRPGL